MSGTVADLRSIRALDAGGVCHDLLEIPAIRELAHLNQWVCWRRESRNEKETKVPYTPSGKLASSTNPATWRSFDACAQAVEAGRFDGLGFVLVEGDGYGGLDLDDVIEPDGRVLDWAVAVVRLARSYTEVSPSGTGLRVIMRTADLPSGFKRTKHAGSIEAYTQGRYLTITGDVFAHSTIKHDTSVIADADLPTLAEHPLLAPPVEPGAAPQPPRGTNGAHSPPGYGDRPEDDPRLREVIVDPRRTVPAAILRSFRELHPRFDAVFSKRRRPKTDASGSGYLMSIAGMLVVMGVDLQQIADVMVEWCHEHDRPDLIIERTIKRPIGKVLRTRDEDGASAVKIDPQICTHLMGEGGNEEEGEEISESEPPEPSEEEIIRLLRVELRCRVERFIKIGAASPEYAIIIAGQRVLLGRTSQLENPSAVWRTIVETTSHAIPAFNRNRWFNILNLLLRIEETEEPDADHDMELVDVALDRLLRDSPIYRGEDYADGLQSHRVVRTPDNLMGVPVHLLHQRMVLDGMKLPVSAVRECLKKLGWQRKTLSFRDDSKRVTSRSYYTKAQPAE